MGAPRASVEPAHAGDHPLHGSFSCTSGIVKDHESRSADAASVGEEVRAFYERHPYPPPVDSLEKYRRLGQDRQKRRADYHLFWPARPYREDQSILIAGCGTSQAAKHALRWPAAQVTGIDFSATSVRSTEELKRKYNLNNLQVCQLPIERVGDLKMSFDQIICTGVLHHLAEPDAGLSALRGVLNPDGGAMHLMVYAPYGRTGIYILQEFCRARSASAPPMSKFAISSMRSRRCHLDIRCKTFSARRPTSGTRQRSPTRCCIRRTAPIQCRSYSSSSKRQD